MGGASGSGSKNPSPYTRNSSGGKGSAGGSATRQPVGSSLYNRNVSNNSRPNLTNQNRPSPNRYGVGASGTTSSKPVVSSGYGFNRYPVQR